ncbi:MAG: hypothetical protein ACRDD1_08180, partial [Planctomycetia bacterium]
MTATSSPLPADDVSNRVAFVGLAVVLACTAFARIQLLPVCLERDEGESADMGALLLDGATPYVEAANMKWPGAYLVHAAGLAVFGRTTEGVHATLAVANLASVAVMFVVGRRLAGNGAAVSAAAVFAAYMLYPRLSGFAGHATHYVVAFALPGLALLARGPARLPPASFFLAGLWFGAAGLMKQPGLAFAGFGAVLTLATCFEADGLTLRRAALRLILLGLGVLTPLAAVLVWLGAIGALPPFYFWTVKYIRTYGAECSWGEVLERAWS